MVLSSRYLAGTTGLITCSIRSAAIFSLVTSGVCWVEIRMVCTRLGVKKPPFLSYSTVTWVLPSGLSHGQVPSLRTLVSSYPSWVAKTWVRA